MYRKDNYRSRLLLQQALYTGRESEGTTLLPANADAADMSEAGWANFGATKSANAVISPDAAFGGCAWTEDTAASRHAGLVSATLTGSEEVTTVSIYVRRPPSGSRRYGVLQLLNNSAVSNVAWYDTFTGKITDYTDDGGTTVTQAIIMRPARFGWWKVTMLMDRNTATAQYMLVGISQQSSAAASSLSVFTPTYTGDSSPGPYTWRPYVLTGTQLG